MDRRSTSLLPAAPQPLCPVSAQGEEGDDDSPRPMNDWVCLRSPWCWCSYWISHTLPFCWILLHAPLVFGAFGFPGLEKKTQCTSLKTASLECRCRKCEIVKTGQDNWTRFIIENIV